MKILAINSSLRGEHGHTAFLVEKLFEGARAGGAECECIVLSKHKINRCLACDKCQGRESYLKCVHEGKDDVKSIFDRMSAADIIIYATPVYIFTISSLLKALLERMHGISDSRDLKMSKSGMVFHHVTPAVCSKPFVAVICCDNIENETPRNTISYFKAFSKFMDAPQVGLMVRNGGRIAGYGKDPARQQIFPGLNDIYAAYVDAGRELARLGHIKSRTQKRASREIIPIPFFHILKQLRPFKKVIVPRAREMMGAPAAQGGTHEEK